LLPEAKQRWQPERPDAWADSPARQRANGRQRAPGGVGMHEVLVNGSSAALPVLSRKRRPPRFCGMLALDDDQQHERTP
jgi:hypothetical protein